MKEKREGRAIIAVARLSQAMIFLGEYYFGLNTEIYYFGMNTGITRLWRALESRATFELASVSLLGAKALAGLTGGNRPVPRPATCQASSSLLLESSGGVVDGGLEKAFQRRRLALVSFKGRSSET